MNLYPETGDRWYSDPLKGKCVKTVSLWRGEANNAMWASGLELPPGKNRYSVLDFFHVFVHDIREWVTITAQTHPYWVFPIAFLIAFSESFVGVSFIIPGTFLLLTMGTVIGASHIGLFPAVAGAIAGSVMGDWISWWIGFHYHHKIVHFALFRRFEAEIEKGLHFFHRWGTWAIFIGRFMGPFRATVPLVAGMSELEFWPFMIANTASAIIWAYVLLAFPALAAHYLLT